MVKALETEPDLLVTAWLMAIFSRSRMTDKLLSVGSLGTVIVGAAAVDETFRGYVAGVLSAPSTTLVVAIERVQSIALHLSETIGYQGSLHAPLALFAVGAGALVLFLLRT